MQRQCPQSRMQSCTHTHTHTRTYTHTHTGGTKTCREKGEQEATINFKEAVTDGTPTRVTSHSNNQTWHTYTKPWKACKHRNGVHLIREWLHVWMQHTEPTGKHTESTSKHFVMARTHWQHDSNASGISAVLVAPSYMNSTGDTIPLVVVKVHTVRTVFSCTTVWRHTLTNQSAQKRNPGKK